MANVNLRKAPKINLSKGQVVCLTKDGEKNSQKLDVVYFGSNWSAIRHKRSVASRFFSRIFGGSTYNEDIENVDLDSSILMYDENFKLIDEVCYFKLKSDCGSITHSGDDTVGDTEDDDKDNETIRINLNLVNRSAKYLVVILNSFRHHKFDKIPYAGLRIYTGSVNNPDEILASYKVDNNPNFVGKEAMVLGCFYRDEGIWRFKADGTPTNERSIEDISKGSALISIKNLL